MSRVYKYRLDYGVCYLELPAGAQLLAVDIQHGWPHLWALTAAEAPLVKRTLLLIGTGYEVPDGARHISTFQVDNGNYIFHAFEIGPEQEGVA